jgi:hypothetical protein
MRVSFLVVTAVLWLLSGPAHAQQWIEFVSREDRFSTNFPGPPRVTQTAFRSQFGAELPARVYSATLGPSRFSVTVADYRQIERILTEKAKSCPEGAETCRGGGTSTGAGYWRADVAGAIVFASSQFLKRDAKVTELIWTNIDLVEGHLLHLTNADGSRTFAQVLMHEQKLYIVEATGPPGLPGPELFQQALGWIDEDGKSIRYQTLYRHGVPAPPRAR